MADLAAPAFHEGHGKASCGELLGHGDAYGLRAGSLAEEFEVGRGRSGGVVHFLTAHEGAGLDVAAAGNTHGEGGVLDVAEGPVETAVHGHAGSAGGHAHESEVGSGLLGDSAGAFESGEHARRFEHDVHRAARIAVGGLHALDQRLGEVGVHVPLHAAGAEQVAAHAAAAELGGDVQPVAGDAAVPRGSGQEAGVAAEGAEVAGVVGEAFQFEGHAAQDVRAIRGLDSGEAFHDSAVGRGVTDGGVAGDVFHDGQDELGGRLQDEVLHVTMLEAELYLEVHHVLAVALEAEMAGFDDAGMHGAHGHFMHFFAFDAVVVGFSRAGAGIAVAFEGGAEAHGLEPRMAFGLHAPHFGEFALEEVGLRAVRRHGLIALGHGGAEGFQHLIGGMAEDADHFAAAFAFKAEEGQHTPAAAAVIRHGDGELFHGEQRKGRVFDGFLVVEHQAPRSAAARLSVSASQSGTQKPRPSTMRHRTAGGSTV